MATKPFKSVTRESCANCSTTMTAPHYINENKSDMRGIKVWLVRIENDGTLSSGPFSSREQCNEKIIQPTNGTMATTR
ncbi:MAG: hypothetical protein WBW06_11120 [Xanthobacteraceae bacterium]|jgi:hypothetical protein